MTGCAILAEAALVDVILLVTANASAGHVFVFFAGMALRAMHDHVQAGQRETREVVVEADALLPGFRAVAIIAARAHGAGVRINGAMTAYAI